MLSKKDYYHNFVQDHLEESRRSGLFSAAEARIIYEYLATKELEISPQRLYKIFHYIIRLKTDCKISDFQTCETSEVIAAVQRIRIIPAKPRGLESAADENRTLSRNSIVDMQRAAKAFFIHLAKTRQNKNLDLLSIRDIKILRPNNITISDKDILTAAELDLFFTHCSSKRDNAIFRLMYSAALRIGEICSMKFKDVQNLGTLSDRPVFVQTSGKTGIKRQIPITDHDTLFYLNLWYAVYPGEKHPDAYLFVNARREPLTPAAVSMQLKRIAAAAGIRRDIHPHLFRHTRITSLCRSGLNETYIKKIAWGHDSRLIDTYTHLSPDDIAAALIEIQEPKTPAK